MEFKAKVLSTTFEETTNYKGDRVLTYKYTIASGRGGIGDTMYLSLTLQSPVALSIGDDVTVTVKKDS